MKILATRVKAVPCPKCRERVDVSGAKPFSTIPCTKCAEPLVVPVRMGRFLMMHQLGRGAMSRVYHAIDAALGRHVAVKVLGQESEGQKQLARRCLEEARALASLNHRNVVQIHSVGQKNGQPFIVMELVKGTRLDRLITEHRQIDERRVIQIAIGVAQGLKAAQRVGLVHGDVKPSNILVDSEGVPKLLDFGIARVQGKDSGQTIYGTPHYVAPEIAQTRSIDMRSDIFSLGATMYHMLTGEYPFEGKTTKQIVMARLTTPARDVRELAPSISRVTAEIVARMMMTKPGDRYSTYEQLIHAMNEVIDPVHGPVMTEELGGLADAVGQVSYTASNASRSGTRPRILLKLMASAMVAAVFGVVLGALIWYATHK